MPVKSNQKSQRIKIENKNLENWFVLLLLITFLISFILTKSLISEFLSNKKDLILESLKFNEILLRYYNLILHNMKIFTVKRMNFPHPIIITKISN